MSRHSLSRCVLMLGLVGCGAAEMAAPTSAPPAFAGPPPSMSTDMGAAVTPPRSPTVPSMPAAAAGAAATPDVGEPNAGAGAAATPPAPEPPPKLEPFSFFVASQRVLVQLAGNPNGFGGDLRFGETGDGAGLRGADKICTTIAEMSMPGSGSKQWRAFLSATEGAAGGGPVHAIDRVGEGPWHDRLGRLVSTTKSELAQVRPAAADAAIKSDLPNEDGVPNHNPDASGQVDNHHVLTGSNDSGRLYADDPHVTCNDWTKSEPDTEDAPRVGLSWPRGGRGGGRPNTGGGSQAGDQDPRPENAHWISALDESGCAAGISLDTIGPDPNNPTVGSGGGYGAIYCFALMP
jgi:hypothetical protein